MKKETRNLIGLIVIGLLILSFPAKSQGYEDREDGLFVGTSLGYVSHMNTMAMEVNIGYTNGYTGIYFKLQPNLTRDINSVQIMGLHGFVELAGFRPNIGIDYHFGNTDKVDNPLTGYKFSYGIDKTFRNSACVVSVNMSGKYLYVGVGCKGAL